MGLDIGIELLTLIMFGSLLALLMAGGLGSPRKSATGVK